MVGKYCLHGTRNLDIQKNTLFHKPLFTYSFGPTLNHQDGAGRSKRRWRFSNIGAEQDEKITSLEIKGLTDTKTTLAHQQGPNISQLLHYDLQKGLALSFVYKVSGRLTEAGCALPIYEVRSLLDYLRENKISSLFMCAS